jgi:hypothetical protein
VARHAGRTQRNSVGLGYGNPPYQICHRRFQQWVRERKLERIFRVHVEFWRYDFCLGSLRQCWINEIDGLPGPTETGNARGPFRDSEQLPCDSMSLAHPPVGFGLMSVSQMSWIRDKVGNYFRSFQTSVRRFLILRNCLSCCARATNETLLLERQPDCTARS